MKWVRGHWGIENSLHWVLDVCFREDEQRHWAETAPGTCRGSASWRCVCSRRRKTARAKASAVAVSGAGWKNDYLLDVLAQIPEKSTVVAENPEKSGA